jgi:non-ribosomal peptide synthetase component F
VAPQSSPAPDAGTAVVAVVKDLFFVARIRETARLAGVPLTFARTVDELATALTAGPRFVLLDLTAGLDHDALLGATAQAGVPVLGFTTHALARQTQAWHGRCARVVTKETLTAELPTMLREGVTR